MTDSERPRRFRFVPTVIPVVLIVAVGVFAVVNLGGSEVPESVQITASGPRFDTIAAMFAASDIVVEGTVVGSDNGRTITDPARPDAGFSTRLFQLDATTTFRGSATDVLVIEQEEALLDGTPIEVNGARRYEVGDTGFWFLVRGTGNEFPYVAAINEQGVLFVEDRQRLSPVDIEGITSTGQLRMTLLELHETLDS